MNGSKPRSNDTQNGFLHHQISPKRSKMVRNSPKLYKVGKKFQKFQSLLINSKKFKNSISFEIFTHLSSKLPTQIPGVSSNKIRHRLIQVTPHVLLFLFHAIFLSFHGPFNFLGHLKLCVLAHAGIGVFSTYRAGNRKKKCPNPRTYTVVLQTVVYEAANEVFKGK